MASKHCATIQYHRSDERLVFVGARLLCRALARLSTPWGRHVPLPALANRTNSPARHETTGFRIRRHGASVETREVKVDRGQPRDFCVKSPSRALSLFLPLSLSFSRSIASSRPRFYFCTPVSSPLATWYASTPPSRTPRRDPRASPRAPPRRGALRSRQLRRAPRPPPSPRWRPRARPGSPGWSGDGAVRVWRR